ncbi:MAG: FMN-binding negative transcriptional regulator, partial [Bacteroidota bacterium]
MWLIKIWFSASTFVVIIATFANPVTVSGYFDRPENLKQNQKMYIPKVNLTSDKTEIIEFMKRFSFATIITSKDNFPTATHLPFVLTTKDDQIVLTSHFAKANEHWQDIESNSVLVIFSEPHAYVSTKNYDKELNVPTWNYISIHAYGQGKLIT